MFTGRGAERRKPPTLKHIGNSAPQQCALQRAFTMLVQDFLNFYSFEFRMLQSVTQNMNDPVVALIPTP